MSSDAIARVYLRSGRSVNVAGEEIEQANAQSSYRDKAKEEVSGLILSALTAGQACA